MEFYNYKYGNYNIDSQYPLSNISEATCTDTYPQIIKIRKYKHQIEYNRCISYSDDDIQYYFDFVKNTIYVNNYTLNSFAETIYALPLTLILIYNGYVPLHCSAVENNGNIFLFMADKGIGKSTLALYLSKYINIFTDDQLFVLGTDNKLFFKPSNIMKLTHDSFMYIGGEAEYSAYYNNFYNKAIINIDDKINNCRRLPQNLKIKKCFFLERYKGNNFKTESITKDITAKTKLFQNISLKKYLNQEDFSKIIKSPFWDSYTEIEYSKLYIPDITDYYNNIKALLDILC